MGLLELRLVPVYQVCRYPQKSWGSHIKSEINLSRHLVSGKSLCKCHYYYYFHYLSYTSLMLLENDYYLNDKQMLQKLGNKKAREVYEANLPDTVYKSEYDPLVSPC